MSEDIQNDSTNGLENPIPKYDASKKNIKPKEKYNDKLWQHDYGSADLSVNDINYNLAQDYIPIYKEDEATIYKTITINKVLDYIENSKELQKLLKLEVKLTKNEVVWLHNDIISKFSDVDLIELVCFICEYFEISIKKYLQFLPTRVQQEIAFLLKDRNRISNIDNFVKCIKK